MSHIFNLVPRNVKTFHQLVVDSSAERSSQTFRLVHIFFKEPETGSPGSISKTVLNTNFRSCFTVFVFGVNELKTF